MILLISAIVLVAASILSILLLGDDSRPGPVRRVFVKAFMRLRPLLSLPLSVFRPVFSYAKWALISRYRTPIEDDLEAPFRNKYERYDV